MSLGDIKLSMRMRDVIASIAASVVEQMRPEERIGKVFSYNGVAHTAQILFAGENIDSLVTVHVAPNMAPEKTMNTTYNTAGLSAEGSIVRVAGSPGKYYITDYVTGSPDLFLGKQVGFVWMWPGSTVPNSDYLFLRGQSFLGSDYPGLAAIVGDTFGTHSNNTYYLPNMNARSPIGVGGTAGIAGNVNNYSLGLKWGNERYPAHSHNGNTNASYAEGNGYSSVPEAYYTGLYGLFQTADYQGRPMIWTNNQGVTHIHSFTTGVGDGNQSSDGMGNVHPVLGMNFIVKGR